MRISGVRLSFAFLLVLAGGLLADLPSMAAAQATTAQAPAKQVTIHLNAANSRIAWILHDSTHTVKGTFQFKGGLITFNPATGVADGELLVDVASGASGNNIRDNKMKTQVLETQKYPTAFFHPTQVAGSLAVGRTQQLTVQGTLNIHGADHPLTLKVQAALRSGMVTATTSFELPYVAWGMRDPSVLVLRVAKQVQVDATLKGSIEGAP